jgi:hypothetical protein
MKRLSLILLLLSVPALAWSLCEPQTGMTKKEVLALCGDPDYTEIIEEDGSDTALPFTEQDLALIEDEGVVVVWHYAPFGGENSRMVLFRRGRVVRCCLPRTD